MSSKVKQEIEAKINKVLVRFLKEHLGEEATEVSTEVVEDTIIVRFKGVLPLAERHLSENPEGARLIHELKMKLIEEVKPALEICIEDITKAKVKDIHSSFNLVSGERIEVFTLDKKI
ncbi:MAG: DUF2294 domain-containing protein [Candidatus Omnitrophica bacterium]|nr:DUF2294 domain-containing protein [Candidatus Omnitrophota bacterium]